MLRTPAHRVYAPMPSFDPEQGVVVLSPERRADGYWAGCAGVLREEAKNRFLLTYRQRRPRGHGELERGWRCAVAVSDDGVAFRDLWSVHKTDLGASSMERFSILPAPDGRYQLYLSYVDPADSRWRVDVVEADTPDAFDVSKAEPVLTAESTGTEGVKDPYVLRLGPVVYLFVSFAQARHFNAEERERAHATADIYNVGVTTCPTGLATSLDGRTFNWLGEVLAPGSGWDRYQARLTSVVPVGNAYLGFYDGSASAEENYEEHCGLAVSHDLTSWHRLSAQHPWVTGHSATGSVRYVDALVVGDEWWLYYEAARPDGAHELRLHRATMS